MNLKYYFQLFLLLVLSVNCWSQQGIGIGTDSDVQASAALEVESTNKGMLIPRMSSTQRTALASTAATGLLVFDSDLNAFFYFDAAIWVKLLSGSKNDADADPNNELQSWDNLPNIPADFLDNIDDVDDADADPTNELQDLNSVLTKSNDVNATKIANLQDPVDNQDAATKNYMDEQLDLLFSIPIGLTTNLEDELIIGGIPKDIAINGDFAYICNNNPGNHKLQVIDISDPNNMTNVSELPVAGFGVFDVKIQGDYAFLFSLERFSSGGYDRLVIIDISDPSNPTHVGSQVIELISTLEVQGSYAYIGSNEADSSEPNGLLKVYNISDPTNLIFAGEITLGGKAISISAQNEYAYVANSTDNKLQIIDISNPQNLIPVGELLLESTPRDIEVIGSKAYLTNHDNKLEIIDISNPFNPVKNGDIGMGGTPEQLVLQDNFAFIANSGNDKLQIVDISNGMEPIMNHEGIVGSDPTSLAVQNNYAYIVSEGVGTLQAIKIDVIIQTMATDASGKTLKGAWNQFEDNVYTMSYQVGIGIDAQTAKLKVEGDIIATTLVGDGSQLTEITNDLNTVLNNGNDANALNIKKLADPIGSQDMATKNFVDSYLDAFYSEEETHIQTLAFDPFGMPIPGPWNQSNEGAFTMNNKVGIGKLSPATKLDVMGTITAISFLGNGSALTNLAHRIDEVLGVENFAINQNITNLSDPNQAQSVATKSYVDTQIENFQIDLPTGTQPQTMAVNGYGATVAGPWIQDENSMYTLATKVGIGTSTPSSALTIAPNKYGAKITFLHPSPTNGHSGFGVSDGQLNYHVRNGGYHVFHTNNVFVIFHGSGNVGINLNASEKLQVGGNILTSGNFYAAQWNGVLNAGGGIMNSEYNIISDGTLPSIISGDEDLYIEGDLEIGGQAYKPGGGSWYGVSDERLKKDIHSYTDGLSQVMQIKPVWYRYNDLLTLNDNNKMHVGVLAQQIAEVAPYMVEEKAFWQVVEEDAEGNEIIVDPGTKYLTYDSSALDFMLINAVKEQHQLLQAEKRTLDKIIAAMNKAGIPVE